MLRDVPGLKDAVEKSSAQSTQQVGDNEELVVAGETDQAGSRRGAAEQKSHALATPVGPQEESH